MPRNIFDHLAISLSPDEAEAMLASVHDILLVFQPDEEVIRYSGRILIHTLGFPDEDEMIKENCRSILQKLGWSEDDFPAHAIQGWASVQQVIPYNAANFARDAERHNCGHSMSAYQKECGCEDSQPWGIILEDFVLLDPPIYDVLPPVDIGQGDLWSPQDPLHLEAFKMALKTQVGTELT